MRILTVEEDPVASRSLEFTVAKWGYDVVAYSDVKAGLETLQESKYLRLAVLNYTMLSPHDLKVCQELRQGEVYILMIVSQEDQTGDLKACLEGSADDLMIASKSKLSEIPELSRPMVDPFQELRKRGLFLTGKSDTDWIYMGNALELRMRLRLGRRILDLLEERRLRPSDPLRGTCWA